MTTTRREFLQVSGLASAGLLLPQVVWSAPGGSRTPAPKTPPALTKQAEQALARSHILGDAPMCDVAVETAVAAGASYADARLVSTRTEAIDVRDDHIESVRRGDAYGIGVRVIAAGGWGFSATPILTQAAVAEAARRAVAQAKIAGKLRADLGKPPVELAPTPVATGGWVAPHEADPLGVPIGDKAAVLLGGTAAVLATPGVQHAAAGLAIVVEDKLLVTSEGTRVHQIAPRIMPRLTATAIDRRRGRFASRNFEVAPMQAGWEYVSSLRLAEAGAEIAGEVLMKLHAAPVTAGERHVILAPSNLWLTIHESIGHSTELDRALGLEANMAGTSFLGPEDAGTRQIGDTRVSVAADRTQPGGLATVGWDDDGVAAERWDLVRDGVFVDWQTTRDQAKLIGAERSHGCSYGQGFDGMPFQRMPNVSLQPGPEDYTTEDLVNATEDGVLISGRGSWSIDHQRYNFQFSGQMFWEIKRGRITEPLRDVAYQANTVEFWKSCDMLGGAGTYRLGGTFGDGKGEPMQSNACSHGCVPGRFRVNIINTGGQS